MDSIYQDALAVRNKVNESALRDTYVSILIEAVLFYDHLAKLVLGRSPKHIILLHEKDLAALYLGDLVQTLRKKGWKIISPRKAYLDPIANFLSSHVFSNNPGRIAEIAQSRGWKEDRDILWHQACGKKYLEDRFSKNKVFLKN